MPQQIIKQGFRTMRRELAVVGAVLVVAILVTGWMGDRRSCLRQVDIRRALIEQRQINQSAIAFYEARGDDEIAARLRQRVEADSHIHELDCSQLLPGV